VKPANTPFDGSSIETTPPVDTGMPTGDGSAVPLTELANGLTAKTLYHGPIRIDADSPFFPYSPWFTLAVLADGAQEARRHDLRWDGHDSAGDALPAGVYLLRLETAGRVTSRKLVIAR
jgi:hypothetical protein